MIHKGCIARCSLGLLGLVTSDKLELVTYPDENTGMAWTGIQLTDSYGGVGNLWSSRHPTLVMTARSVRDFNHLKLGDNN